MKSLKVQFKLAGIPISFSFGFWLGVAAFGFILTQDWKFAVLVAISTALAVLIHELGHALVAKRFDQEPVIVQRGLSGGWLPRSPFPVPRGAEWKVYAGGPALGGLAALLSFALQFAFVGKGMIPTFFRDATQLFAATNFYWTAVNLLPALPFDGGRLVSIFLGPERRNQSYLMSLLTAVSLSIVAYRLERSWLPVIIFLAIGFGVYNDWSRERRKLDSDATNEYLKSINLEGNRLNMARSAMIARTVFSIGEKSYRPRAVEFMAWTAIRLGQGAALRNIFTYFEADYVIDRRLLAAKAQFEGDLELAADELRHLSDQRELNSKDRGWLLRLLIDSEKLDEAFIEAEAFVDEIPTDDLRQLILLGLEKHQLKAALPLQRSLFERHNEFQDGKEWLKSLLALNHWDEAQKLASSLKEKDEWESIHSDLTLSAQLKQLEGKWLSGSSSYQPLKADS